MQNKYILKINKNIKTVKYLRFLKMYSKKRNNDIVLQLFPIKEK